MPTPLTERCGIIVRREPAWLALYFTSRNPRAERKGESVMSQVGDRIMAKFEGMKQRRGGLQVQLELGEKDAAKAGLMQIRLLVFLITRSTGD